MINILFSLNKYNFVNTMKTEQYVSTPTRIKYSMAVSVIFNKY